MAVHANFYEDWIAMLRAKLAQGALPAGPADSSETVAFRYFNVQRRLIHPKPRTVHRTSSFLTSPSIQEGLQLIEGRFVRGDDLTPHLSTKIGDPDYADAMLNDWGIHHLHLGTASEPSGFVERTGPVLYAYVTDSDAYFLTVAPHGGWSNQQLVQALHDNWPFVLTPYKITGFNAGSPLTNGQIAKLRKCGVYTPVQVSDGTMYAPPGGGISTSGTSVDALSKHDNFAHFLVGKQKALLARHEEIRISISKQGVEVPATLNFRLEHRNNNQFVAVETGTGFEVDLAAI
jgi:hypothetical protein